MSLFCLVHGSTQTDSGWMLLGSELDKCGHQVVCADLPGDQPKAGGVYYARIIADSLTTRTDSEGAILVAHSAGGLFLPLVPMYCRISRLVFLAAIIPQIGMSFLDQLRAEPDMIWPDWIGKDPTQDKEIALHFLFHDCSADVAGWALTTLRRMRLDAAMSEVCPAAAWPQVPSSYILCREDRTARPEWCRQAARNRLGVEPIELPGGHCPHVSRPKELAKVLARLVTEG